MSDSTTEKGSYMKSSNMVGYVLGTKCDCYIYNMSEQWRSNCVLRHHGIV